MSGMKDAASPVVVIGDVVSSRTAPDRRHLHRVVERTLATVDGLVAARDGLRVTVGDEFQATYSSLGAALEAALLVRVDLLPEVDVRIGVGRGEVTVLDADRGLQDGPGWWSAREAVEAAEAAAERAATRWSRTAYRSADPDPAQDAVNAALLCRDHLVGSLSERSGRLLRGLMEPQVTQLELAARGGISASAVSQ